MSCTRPVSLPSILDSHASVYGNADQVRLWHAPCIAEVMKQRTLAMAADYNAKYEQSRKPTRRDLLLPAMQHVVPRKALCSVIEPHHPKVGSGRPPIGLRRMLRMYFVQHWFNLAYKACEEALLDSASLRRFEGIDLGRERVPDASSLLKFRRSLEKHELGAGLFAKVGEALQGQGLKGGTGTMVVRHHQRAQLDQERRGQAGSRDAPDLQRPAVVFRHEAAHRGEQQDRPRTQRGRDRCPCERQEPDAQPVRRCREEGLQ